MQANFSSAILDGEILIWNKRTYTFMPLKNVRPVLEAARNHCGPGTIIKEVLKDDADGEEGTQHSYIEYFEFVGSIV